MRWRSFGSGLRAGRVWGDARTICSSRRRAFSRKSQRTGGLRRPWCADASSWERGPRARSASGTRLLVQTIVRSTQRWFEAPPGASVCPGSRHDQRLTRTHTADRRAIAMKPRPALAGPFPPGPDVPIAAPGLADPIPCSLQGPSAGASLRLPSRPRARRSGKLEARPGRRAIRPP